MGKTKVLHIITRLDFGGSATNTIETVARLDKSRYKVLLISGKTHDPDGRVRKMLKAKKVHCLYLDELVRDISPWKDLDAFIKLVLIIGRSKCDIVHTHSSKAGLLGRWAAWWARVENIVHTPHGHVFYGYFNAFKTGLFVFLERITALITDKIITLTEQGKQDHIDFKIASSEKFVPIYSGIDIAEFQRQDIEPQLMRQRGGLAKDDFVFACIGRLDPIKGQQYLLEAVEKLSGRFNQMHVLLVGEGSERKRLQELSEEKGLSQKVHFLGYHADVVPWLRVSDALVLCSLNEGMGRVILEAMACQKPVIATKVGGVPELVSPQTGLLVPPSDVDALAEAMGIFMKDPSGAQTMGERALASVTTKFSIQTMVQQIDELYQELLK